MEKYLLYLNFDNNLPSYYYSMAQEFSSQGVTLLPVTIEQLQLFINQHEMNYLICSTTKSDHIKKFKIKMERLLKNGLNSNVLTVYHLSSFSNLNLTKTNMISKNYYMVQLPIPIGKLVKNLSKHFMTNKSKKLSWPGGKRSTLPHAS